MKAIMISISPQYVEKILNGGKTIEIRKTMPKCELPCKVYIYCTNGYMLYDIRNENCIKAERKCTLDYTRKSNKYLSGTPPMLNGKVVAEFTLNKVDILERDLNDWLPKNRYDISNELLKNINLNQEQLWNYGQGKTLSAWRIDHLKVYDKPKELSEFSTISHRMKGKESRFTSHLLQRPPQSWCYVEELENE